MFPHPSLFSHPLRQCAGVPASLTTARELIRHQKDLKCSVDFADRPFGGLGLLAEDGIGSPGTGAARRHTERLPAACSYSRNLLLLRIRVRQLVDLLLRLGVEQPEVRIPMLIVIGLACPLKCYCHLTGKPES